MVEAENTTAKKEGRLEVPDLTTVDRDRDAINRRVERLGKTTEDAHHAIEAFIASFVANSNEYAKKVSDANEFQRKHPADHEGLKKCQGEVEDARAKLWGEFRFPTPVTRKALKKATEGPGDSGWRALRELARRCKADIQTIVSPSNKDVIVGIELKQRKTDRWHITQTIDAITRAPHGGVRVTHRHDKSTGNEIVDEMITKEDPKALAEMKEIMNGSSQGASQIEPPTGDYH